MTWTFRRLSDEDLPLLHEWLNEPGVVRFWEGDDVSWPGVIAQYGSPEARATLETDFPDFDYDEEEADFDWEHVEVYLGLLDGEPTGWIQCVAVEPYSDHDEVKAWVELGYELEGATIDYLIGDPAARGNGWGSAMIENFVHAIVFGQHAEWPQVGVSPVRANVASCRALAKAGFELFGSFDDPEFGPCDLYTRRR